MAILKNLELSSCFVNFKLEFQRGWDFDFDLHVRCGLDPDFIYILRFAYESLFLCATLFPFSTYFVIRLACFALVQWMIFTFLVVFTDRQAFCCLGVVQSGTARSRNQQGRLKDVYHLIHQHLPVLLTRLLFHIYHCHVVELY